MYWLQTYILMFVCLFVCSLHGKKIVQERVALLFKRICDFERGSVFFNGLSNNTWMSSQAWEALLYLKIWVELFHILLCLYHFYKDSTFMENVEETLKIEEYSSPWYCIDLWSSNFWKKNKFWRKESFFLKNFYDSPREKFSKRRTYSIDPFPKFGPLLV